MSRAEHDAMYSRFRANPSPVLFSPALAPHTQEHEGIVELAQIGPTLKHMSYMGEFEHPRLGLLSWQIIVLPEGGPFDIELAMLIRVHHEIWLPDNADLLSLVRQ
jgi:hypothetical protein